MKPPAKAALTALALLLCLAPPARAGNVTEAVMGCAPWDGPTLELKIGAPDVVISARIWARGYEDLQGGAKDVEINNKWPSPEVTDSTGEAAMQGASAAAAAAPQPVVLDVHFDTLELKEGGRAAGYVNTKGSDMHIPFDGTITVQGPCG